MRKVEEEEVEKGKEEVVKRERKGWTRRRFMQAVKVGEEIE